MRRHFHDRLDRLVGDLTDMATQVEASMRAATTALFDADVDLAEAVRAGDTDLRAAQVAVDELAVDLLAREQPVATDLRTIVACLRMSADLRRMGRLAVHVADVARDRHPGSAVPEALCPVLRRMSERALELMTVAARAVALRDDTALAVLERGDDQVDELQEELYRELLGTGPRLSVKTAAAMALLARYYERYADHAVELSRRMAFLTGHSGLDIR